MASQVMAISAGQLQFADTNGCRRWLAALPLTNISSAHQLLAQQVELLRHALIAPAERLQILELLQEPVSYVQTELARKFTGKPQPLDVNESALWARAQFLSLEMADAWIICRDAHAKGDLRLEDGGARAVVQAMRHTEAAMFDHYRIYRQVPPALWKKMHQLYTYAEQSGFSCTAVASTTTTAAERGTTCLAVYCQALLAHLANPFALTGRQMEFLAQWLVNWSPLMSVSKQPMPPSAIPALAVDLAGEAGPAFAEGLQPVTSLRHLDLESIGRTLRQLITLLKQGQTPGQLGLGNDARQPGCENLLMLLYIQWCRAGTGRGEQRIANAESAQVCIGLHASHFQISERAFRPPGTGLSRKEEHDMQLFGHISERTERQLASHQSMAVESWRLVNQSNSGFMCMLRDADAQLRLCHHQLVAVRRGSSKLFYVGLIQWIRMEDDKSLFVGVRLFPGIARAIAVRPANFKPLGDTKNGYERGLLLPELPAPTTPTTLLLPAGWFQPGRFVELHGEQKNVAKLLNLLEKGSDFDRCTVSIV
jgi:hypothetical protein